MTDSIWSLLRRVSWAHNRKIHQHWILILASWLCFFGPHVLTLRGQSDNPAERIGIRPFESVQKVENGYVNLSTGDLHLEIPLGSWSERGGRVISAAIAYDSAIWKSIDFDYVPFLLPLNIQFGSLATGVGHNTAGPYPPGAYQFPTEGGWYLKTPVGGGPTWAEDDSVAGECSDSYGDDRGPMEVRKYAWTYSQSDGTSHAFNFHTLANYPNICNNYDQSATGGSGWAIDASGYYMLVDDGQLSNQTIHVYAPDGSEVYPLPKDFNGNYDYPDACCGLQLKDSSGRPLVQMSYDDASNPNYVYFDVLNAQGTTSRYTVVLESVNFNTDWNSHWDCGYYGCYDSYGTLKVPQSIQLPDGSSYLFGYDDSTSPGHYGNITSMTLPTGGQVTYSFDFLGTSPSYAGGGYRVLKTRTTPDSSTPWTYNSQYNNESNCTPLVDCQLTTTIAKPNGDSEIYNFLLNSGGSWPMSVQYYDSSGNWLATSSQSFDFSHSCGAYYDSYCWEYPSESVAIVKLSETTAVPTPSGSVSAKTSYIWDTAGYGQSSLYGNVMYKKEWNFGSDTGGSPDRTTAYTYWSDSNPQYVDANILNRLASETVTDGNNQTVRSTVNSYDGSGVSYAAAVNHDDANYGTGNNVRGNLTQVQRWTGTGSPLTKNMAYDMTGQKSTETDWNGSEVITYSYSDNFVGGGNGPTNAYPTTVADDSLTTTYGYYWGTGQVASMIDPNGQTTSYQYDSSNRPTLVQLPNGGWTYTTYPDANHVNVAKGISLGSASYSSSCNATAGDCRSDQTVLEGLGRVSSKTLTSDPDGNTTVGTGYDSNGRVFSTTTPYRGTSDSTYGVETALYDGLDRIWKQTNADLSVTYTYYGAAVGSYGGRTSQLCTGYGPGYPVLNLDEAGHSRQRWIDGFGRLIEVDEPDPSSGSLSSGSPFGTCYTYDLNDNLTGVTQGAQTRSFHYDGVSRLTLATNPEAGTVNYHYDQDTNCPSPNSFPSQLVSKTDARGVRTCMQYDDHNRLYQKSYSDGTPQVNYGYDQGSYNGLSIANGKTRRTGMGDGSGNTAWSYDAIGNITTEKRTIGGVTKTTTYTYNFDSSLASITYPSGSTISYAVLGAQRPASAVDVSSGINYATNAHYTPPGALAQLKNGANLYSTSIYNNRLQPCWLYTTTGSPLSWVGTQCASSTTAGSTMDRKYSYGSGNNGNVMGITDNITSTRSQSFTYDALNRIATAAASNYSQSSGNCWGETFSIDRYGNLTGIGVISSAYNGCTQESPGFGVNTSTNQLANPRCYDAAGNLLGHAGCVTTTYAYNAENQLTSTTGLTYTYDGDGKRVKKSTGVLYWYGLDGNPLAESDGSGNITDEYIFFGGKRIARRRY